MPFVLVRHKLESYDKWKPIFDEHGSARKAMGSKGGYLFRNADDPNEVIVVLEVADLGRAREFIQSQDLRATMQRAGVSDQPSIYFLNEAERPPV